MLHKTDNALQRNEVPVDILPTRWLFNIMLTWIQDLHYKKSGDKNWLWKASEDSSDQPLEVIIWVEYATAAVASLVIL